MTSEAHNPSRNSADSWNADRVGHLAWRGKVVERGGWLFRTAQGFTRRANSATPVSADRMVPSDAIAWVLDQAASTATPPLLQLSDHPMHAPERAACDARGIGGVDETLVMVAPSNSARPDDQVVVAETVGEQWHDCWNVVSGGPTPRSVSRGFFGNLDSVLAARIGTVGSSAECVGLGVVTADGTYLCAIATLPHARGRGLATRLVAHLMATSPPPHVLNVVPSNPAVALYERLGFETRHRYAYYELG